MQPAPLGIDTRIGTAAAVLLYAGPAAGFILGSPLRSQPVLQLMGFFGAILGIFPLLFPAFIALGMVRGNADISPADARTLNSGGRPALLVLFDAAVRDVVRFAMLWLLVKGERFFRNTGNQVMYFSRVRMLPCAAACGFGFGLIRGLSIVASSAGAAMTVSSTTSSEGFVLVAPPSVGLYVDLDACPWMPLLVLQCSAHLMSLIGDTAWAVLWLPAAIMWSADATEFEKLQAVPPKPLEKNDGEEYKDAAAAAAVTNFASPVTPAPTTTTAASSTAAAPLMLFSGYRMTVLSSRPVYLGLALTAFVTHIIFAGASLVNNGAFDWGTMQPVANRGCEVSLSVQAIMVLLALAAVVFAVRKERFEIPAGMMVPGVKPDVARSPAGAAYAVSRATKENAATTSSSNSNPPLQATPQPPVPSSSFAAADDFIPCKAEDQAANEDESINL